MAGTKQKRHKLPEARTITLPEAEYQPRKAEQEKEHDMPGVSLKTARRAFFRPFNLRRENDAG